LGRDIRKKALLAARVACASVTARALMDAAAEIGMTAMPRFRGD